MPYTNNYNCHKQVKQIHGGAKLNVMDQKANADDIKSSSGQVQPPAVFEISGANGSTNPGFINVSPVFEDISEADHKNPGDNDSKEPVDQNVDVVGQVESGIMQNVMLSCAAKIKLMCKGCWWKICGFWCCCGIQRVYDRVLYVEGGLDNLQYQLHIESDRINHHRSLLGVHYGRFLNDRERFGAVERHAQNTAIDINNLTTRLDNLEAKQDVLEEKVDNDNDVDSEASVPGPHDLAANAFSILVKRIEEKYKVGIEGEETI